MESHLHWKQSPGEGGREGGDHATKLPLSQAAISLLKQEYQDMPSLESALQLAVKVLYKTLDSTKLNSEKGLHCCALPLHLATFPWASSD